MDFEVKKLINDLSEDIIKIYELKLPICNIESVVYKMGGTIDFNYNASNYADPLLIKNKNSFKIIIPNELSEKRKNFIVAQCIGHLFLHMGYQIDNSLWNVQPERKYYSNIQINQAQAFAMAFLMPKSEFKNILNNNSNGYKVNMTAVAEHFNTQEYLAVQRGVFLNYIEDKIFAI